MTRLNVPLYSSSNSKTLTEHDCSRCKAVFTIISQIDDWGVELKTGGLLTGKDRVVCNDCELDEVTQAVEHDDQNVLLSIRYLNGPILSRNIDRALPR